MWVVALLFPATIAPFLVAPFFATAEVLDTTRHGGVLTGPGDPVVPILLALVLIALGAALGGRAMVWFGQAAVLGELLIGMLVVNVGYWLRQPIIIVLREGETIRKIVDTALVHSVNLAEAAHQVLPAGERTQRLAEVLSSSAGLTAVTVYGFVDLLSRIAVIVLLFLVGLETSVAGMLRVGRTAFLVAVLGVVVPFALGWGTIALLLPQVPLAKGLFTGGILTATSVGITARVLRDLRQAHRAEAKVILGAAVIDDVLGLLVLAVVTALVTTGTIHWLGLVGIAVKAVVFLLGSILVGLWITPRLVKRLAQLRIANVKLLFGLGLAFVLSWLASAAGLATIVGAFAAGLVLEDFFDKELEGHSLRDLLSPVESLIVPVFFVLMGMQVKLETFADGNVMLMAAVLTLVAILGKVVSGLACGRELDRLSVGIGMMPRGEVGLIFAGIGKSLGVVNDAVFSAVVVMVMVTTVLTPPLLKRTLARSHVGTQ